MKVNIEIDCTPEEARSFMGLPDVTEANSVYVDGITKAMKGVSNPAQMQEYAQALAPMGLSFDGKVSPFHGFPLPFAFSHPDVEKLTDIAYGESLPGDQGGRNLLDVVRPKAAQPGDRRAHAR